MAGTVSELMEGLGIGLCIVAVVAFPWFIESVTDVICAATQKVGKKFTKILNRS